MLQNNAEPAHTEIAYHISMEIKDNGYSPKCCGFHKWMYSSQFCRCRIQSPALSIS